LGIGDWGLGIGDWGLGPIPNPQSPIKIIFRKIFLFKNKLIKIIIFYNYLYLLIYLLIKCQK